MSTGNDATGNDNASVGPDRATKFERTKRRDMLDETDRQIIYAHGHMGKIDKALEQIENPIARDKMRAMARSKIFEHLRKGGEFNPPTMKARAIARRVEVDEFDRKRDAATRPVKRELGHER